MASIVIPTRPRGQREPLTSSFIMLKHWSRSTLFCLWERRSVKRRKRNLRTELLAHLLFWKYIRWESSSGEGQAERYFLFKLDKQTLSSFHVNWILGCNDALTEILTKHDTLVGPKLMLVSTLICSKIMREGFVGTGKIIMKTVHLQKMYVIKKNTYFIWMWRSNRCIKIQSLLFVC